MSHMKIVVVCAAVLLISVMCTSDDTTTGGNANVTQHELSANHNVPDVTLIPAQWIDSVKLNLRVHYAHTSHGSQLTTGLTQIESSDTTYDVAIAYNQLPNESGALNIFDGQESETYITPDLYWQTTEGMNYTRDVLNNNPTINVSLWSWCTQLDYYSDTQVQEYIDSIAVLASEFPNVTFVYMTCNAQGTDAEGYNRYQRNEEIRQYCDTHDRFLFDFADLDAWWYDESEGEWEQATYEYDTISVPVEHPEFHGDEAGHTTYESCEQKGRAVWWLMARIAGWQP
jgi:hypothetical protein